MSGPVGVCQRFIFFTRRIRLNRVLLANCLVSSGLTAAGDVVQQRYQVAQGHLLGHSSVRTVKMATAGLTTGFFCHYWYVYLDRILPGRSLKTLLKKVLLDQVCTPLQLLIFFSTLAVLNRSTVLTFLNDVRCKVVHLFLVDTLIWPPAQLINFYLLPTKYRVTYVNILSFLFDIYCSYIAHKPAVHKPRPEMPAVPTKFQSFSLVGDEISGKANLGDS